MITDSQGKVNMDASVALTNLCHDLDNNACDLSHWGYKELTENAARYIGRDGLQWQESEYFTSVEVTFTLRYPSQRGSK